MGDFCPKTGHSPRVPEPTQEPRFRAGQVADFTLQKIGYITAPVALEDGESYNLGGFAIGKFRISWDDGAVYATFVTSLDGSGDPQVALQVDDDGNADTNGIASVASTPVNNTTHFFVNDDDELVLTNGTGTSGNDRVYRIDRRA